MTSSQKQGNGAAEAKYVSKYEDEGMCF